MYLAGAKRGAGGKPASDGGGQPGRGRPEPPAQPAKDRVADVRRQLQAPPG